MSSSRCPTLTHSEALAGATIALTGSGSSGVMAAGTLLLAAAARAGAHDPVVRTGGPQIRGAKPPHWYGWPTGRSVRWAVRSTCSRRSTSTSN